MGKMRYLIFYLLSGVAAGLLQTYIWPSSMVPMIGASGAVAGLAPTTEADLGDGTFPGHAYLDANGHFGVGSDSNTAISPFA